MPPTEPECPNALLPDGPICPRCGGPRAPSGVDGGSWVHFPRCPTQPAPPMPTDPSPACAGIFVKDEGCKHHYGSAHGRWEHCAHRELYEQKCGCDFSNWTLSDRFAPPVSECDYHRLKRELYEASERDRDYWKGAAFREQETWKRNLAELRRVESEREAERAQRMRLEQVTREAISRFESLVVRGDLEENDTAITERFIKRARAALGGSGVDVGAGPTCTCCDLPIAACRREERNA